MAFLPNRPTHPDGLLHGVVAGVRRVDGRWLMIRRSKHVNPYPLRVCFPGGLVEPGETQPAAVIREMAEELGVVVRPVRQVWQWDFPDRSGILWGWFAEIASGQLVPNPAEIAEILWLSAAEGSDHPDGVPSNRSFLSCLEAHFIGPARAE